MAERVGFIGLGIMGRGMVSNLLKHQFTVCVWNRTASRMAPFVQQGAVAGTSPADVAAQSDIIITCVSDTKDVQHVVVGEQGILETLDPGKLVIDMSTISPEVTRELGNLIEAKGSGMLDAPISGGSEGAEKGTLSIMIGGDAAHVERAMPYFEAMGKTITHVGPRGAGQAVKLVNQILVVVTMLGVSEALLFAQASGVDLERTLDAVTQGAAGSWMLSNRGPQVIERDWRPGFTIDLQQKDLRLVLEAADQLSVPLMGTSMIYQLYKSLQDRGAGGDGNHALIKALEFLSNKQVGSIKD